MSLIKRPVSKNKMACFGKIEFTTVTINSLAYKITNYCYIITSHSNHSSSQPSGLP